MLRDELQTELKRMDRELRELYECQNRTARLYPPDGAGHGAKWEVKIRRVQGYRSELQAKMRALDEGEEVQDIYRDPEFQSTCSIVLPDFSEISDELLEHFAKNPRDLHELNWRKFEELLEAVFRNQGYETKIGPGRADGGVDLRLVTKDSIGPVVTLVQAKKYAWERPIRLEAVQALSAVVDDRKANRGLFVTTSRYLTSAREFAERQSRRLVLADADDVAKWCELAAKQWR